MNDVDPFAFNLNCVFSVSSSVETKMKVARGHHPGNGRRTGHRQAAHRIAASETTVTYPQSRSSRVIIEKDQGSRPLYVLTARLAPRPPLTERRTRRSLR